MNRIVSSPMESVKQGLKPPGRTGTGVGGWLLLLCALLLIWQPVSLALLASSVVGQIALRGLSLVLVLVARVMVAALGIAAGIALAGRRPAAVTMAKVSLVASAVTDVFFYSTSYFPSNRLPGDTPLYAAASLAYYGIWLVYLYRSKRVKRTFNGATSSLSASRPAWL
jgi:hypothetical protein